jgi:hypothetical protein
MNHRLKSGIFRQGTKVLFQSPQGSYERSGHVWIREHRFLDDLHRFFSVLPAAVHHRRMAQAYKGRRTRIFKYHLWVDHTGLDRMFGLGVYGAGGVRLPQKMSALCREREGPCASVPVLRQRTVNRFCFRKDLPEMQNQEHDRGYLLRGVQFPVVLNGQDACALSGVRSLPVIYT